MNEFLTWEMLLDYAILVIVVIAIVQFTKEIKFIKSLPTKYWSLIISFILIISANLYMGLFEWSHMMIYFINAILVSLTTNGAHNFVIDKDKKIETVKPKKKSRE